MLVALKGNGETVSLLQTTSRQMLDELRKNETFYCPVCKGKVLLKLGNEKRWHFSHESKKACVGTSESESPLHLDGKRQLYSWLVKQQVPVALEPYIRSIQQRPDLLFQKGEQLFALEFQCSPIQVEKVKERTEGYLSKGIIPIWIVGITEQENRRRLHILKAYEWHMVQMYKNDSQLFLIRYSPENERWTFLDQLLPISTKKVVTRYKMTSLKNTNINDLCDRIQTKDMYVSKEQWLTARKHWRYNIPPYPSRQLQQFYRLCYEQGFYPSLFPLEAGWPTAYYEWLKTPPHIWQTWVLIQVSEFAKRPFHFKQLYALFKEQVRRRFFSPRFFIHLDGHFSFALMNYLQFLVECGNLKKLAKSKFVMTKSFTIPKHMEHAHEADRMFLEKRLYDFARFQKMFIC